MARPNSDRRREASRTRLGVDSLPRRDLPAVLAPLPQAFVSGIDLGHHHGRPRPPAPAADGPRPDRVQSGIPYVHDATHSESLDLYLPAGTPPAGGWPLIVAFPGGGWRWASRKDYGQAVASAFNPGGFAVAAADYTYAADSGGRSWPTNLSDARAAITWARDHARRIHIDPDRIVAMGESAGANLALLVGSYPDGPVAADAPSTSATHDGPTRVAAVVDFYGPTDLTALDAATKPGANSYLDTFLGGTPAEVPDRYLAASPVTYITPATPPTFIAQGLADRTVVPDQSVELDDALKRAGVTHQFVTIPGVGHGFRFAAGGLPLASEVTDFLRTNLGLDPVATRSAPQ